MKIRKSTLDAAAHEIDTDLGVDATPVQSAAVALARLVLEAK